MRGAASALTAFALLFAPALLALAPAANGAAPWSEPVTVAAPGAVPLRSQPSLGFAASGEGLLTWSTSRIVDGRLSATGHVASWPLGGIPAERRTLDDAVVAPPQALADGRFVLLREQALRPGPSPARLPRVRLSVSIATASGHVGPPRRVATFATANAVALALAPSGQIAVAWVERALPDGARSRLRVRVGRAGRPFGRPRSLAQPSQMSSVAVAWNRTRELVIAYAAGPRRAGRSSRVVVLSGRPRGPLRRHTLGPHAGLARIAAASSERGRVVVAWGSQDAGEQITEPFVVRAAIREPDDRDFRAAQVLDDGGGAARGPARFENAPLVAIARDGTAVTAWSGRRGPFQGMGFTTPVFAATAPAGAPFAAPEQLDANGTIGALAMRADARAILTWTPRPETPPRGLAALREPAAERFSPAEEISRATGQYGAFGTSAPYAAFNPRTGEPAAAWVDLLQRDESGLGLPNQELRAAARVP